mmetsp:Transcript_26676/g.61385  ORF Transcript_26676/g.61385 Transcript_26676/m.61385 type:complete len:85 (-) Transcript_26676:968-1222(-)
MVMWKQHDTQLRRTLRPVQRGTWRQEKWIYAESPRPSDMLKGNMSCSCSIEEHDIGASIAAISKESTEEALEAKNRHKYFSATK